MSKTDYATRYPTLSLKERDRRWASARNFMKQEGLECLLVFGPRGSPQLTHYLTNLGADNVLIFPLVGDPVLLVRTISVVTSHMDSALRGEELWVTDLRPGMAGPRVAALLRDLGYERATIGAVGTTAAGPLRPDGYVPFQTWSQITRSLPAATFKDISAQLYELILVKSGEEQELLRKAAAVGELACEAMLNVTKPGVPESEIYATVMALLHRHGTMGLDGLPMIFHSGPDNISWGLPPWLMRAQPPRLIQEGDVILSEIFPRYGGIDTQQQMCIAVGQVDPIKDKLARIARASYEQGLAALRPGKTFGEVADAMEAPLKEEGIWHLTPLIHSLNPLCWVDRVGEGVHNLSGVEKYKDVGPRPVVGADLAIKPGMTFELEPNACFGKHRVNIGGTVLINETGAEELNEIPTEMRNV